jgi:hypothetical protein
MTREAPERRPMEKSIALRCFSSGCGDYVRPTNACRIEVERSDDEAPFEESSDLRLSS